MEERAKKIIDACLQETSKDPIEIFNHIAQMDFVRIHGPEHHVLDGAALLTAFYNAGGKIELQESLAELMKRGLQMPGATCGMWGVCGAVTSIGAALSIIDGTGPLSTDASWGKHMEFTSAALGSLSKIGGPRCCKRDAFLSFQKAIEFINENQCDLIVICNPNNPTGFSFSKFEIEVILNNTKAFVMVDETYVEFTNTSIYSSTTLVDKYDNLF